MDMMDSMQSVVFPDESDDDFGDSSEKKPLVELSSIAPILGEDAPLLHEKDTLPDTPTKDNLLSRLEGLEGPSYHHKKIESDENLESDENEGLVTQASRLKKSRTTSGVDLLHLDAPVRYVIQISLKSQSPLSPDDFIRFNFSLLKNSDSSCHGSD
jgi:hypothetical protein